MAGRCYQQLVAQVSAALGDDPERHRQHWVEDEVDRAFDEERRRNQLVLFPVRIDDTVMKTPEPWAVKLRNQPQGRSYGRTSSVRRCFAGRHAAV